MRSKLACAVALLLILQPALAQYRTALPGYRYQFPRDHFNHPDFQTEWWYYTGNLKTQDGHKFGFELTFFRQALQRDAQSNSAWNAGDLYLAHLALSDLDGGAFLHAERINRAGPGLAGVDESAQRIWNGNWSVQWNSQNQELQAIDPRFALRMAMRSLKPPVIHGQNGVSQKSEGAGHASHYISLPRLETRGKIILHGKRFDVAGTVWMDHEFFTHQLTREQIGWDWLSIQLDNNTELMLFHLRRQDGAIDRYSSGTFVDAQGKAIFLHETDFLLQPAGKTWTSKETHAAYPVSWKIAVPRLGLELEATTALDSQELTGKTKTTPSYWEGAISLTGRVAHAKISGTGYLEMTGYDKAVELWR